MKEAEQLRHKEVLFHVEKPLKYMYCIRVGSTNHYFFFFKKDNSVESSVFLFNSS